MKWDYKGRKQTIIYLPSNISIRHLETGFHLRIDPETWNVAIVSRVQKQLKQYLYNYLVKNDLPTNEYILIVEGKKMSRGITSFIDLKMVYPNMGEMEVNKAFYEHITDKMYQLFTHYQKLV